MRVLCVQTGNAMDLVADTIFSQKKKRFRILLAFVFVFVAGIHFLRSQIIRDQQLWDYPGQRIDPAHITHCHWSVWASVSDAPCNANWIYSWVGSHLCVCALCIQWTARYAHIITYYHQIIIIIKYLCLNNGERVHCVIDRSFVFTLKRCELFENACLCLFFLHSLRSSTLSTLLPWPVFTRPIRPNLARGADRVCGWCMLGLHICVYGMIGGDGGIIYHN